MTAKWLFLNRLTNIFVVFKSLQLFADVFASKWINRLLKFCCGKIWPHLQMNFTLLLICTNSGCNLLHLFHLIFENNYTMLNANNRKYFLYWIWISLIAFIRSLCWREIMCKRMPSSISALQIWQCTLRAVGSSFVLKIQVSYRLISILFTFIENIKMLRKPPNVTLLKPLDLTTNPRHYYFYTVRSTGLAEQKMEFELVQNMRINESKNKFLNWFYSHLLLYFVRVQISSTSHSTSQYAGFKIFWLGARTKSLLFHCRLALGVCHEGHELIWHSTDGWSRNSFWRLSI